MSDVLVVDVGTSSVRAAVVGADDAVTHETLRPLLPDSPAPGLVEFDARRLADESLAAAQATLSSFGGSVAAVGITNQRGSTVVWDRATGEPVGPALGWQDLRTIGACLEQRANGFRFAPNTSATKIAWLLDTYDPDRGRELCFGTVDTWLAWVLSDGALHVTDATNAGITTLLDETHTNWSVPATDALRIPRSMLPRIVDTAGALGPATALPGAPPIAALVGDQQASLLGQACVRPGPAKITFGTGGMLDLVLGPEPPPFATRGPGGTFPIVTWCLGGMRTWGVEAIILSAGTSVEWLRDDLGILATAEESHEVARQCESTDGVVYVPALLGLGTPKWDYGARGALFGLTRGSGRPHIVRAVLEGIAHRGADLVEAAETDAGQPIAALRVDGGMSRNPTFVQALADASGKAVEVSPVREATTLGAGFLAGIGVGLRSGVDALAATWRPVERYEPGDPVARTASRAQWHEAIERTTRWIPDLSAVDF